MTQTPLNPVSCYTTGIIALTKVLLEPGLKYYIIQPVFHGKISIERGCNMQFKITHSDIIDAASHKEAMETYIKQWLAGWYEAEDLEITPEE